VLQIFKKFLRYLANLEIWLVALSLAASLVSVRFLPAAVLVAAFFWLVRILAYGRLSIRTASDFPILILSAFIPITMWITAFPEITHIQVYRLLSGIGLFYALVNWSQTPKRLYLSINGLIFSGLLLAAISPVAVEWSAKLAFIPAQIYQPFTILLQDTIHPNVMAGSLVLILPFSVSWVLFAWQDINIPEKILAIVSSLVMVFFLILTQSRGAWIAIFIVLIFFPVFRWRWGWVLSILGILATFSIVYILGLTKVLNALVSGGSVRGVQGRMEIWERAYYMIRDFPFTGVGMGSFTKVADSLYPFTLASPGSIFHAHNLILQIGVDLGLIGLSAWIAILVIHFTQAWKSRLNGILNKNPRIEAIGFALMGSTLVLMIHGTMDSVVWGMVRPAPLVWAIWGIGSSLYLHTQMRYPPEPHS
jgi:putative inorganic carbon (HCO3(-)) transporter